VVVIVVVGNGNTDMKTNKYGAFMDGMNWNVYVANYDKKW